MLTITDNITQSRHPRQSHPQHPPVWVCTQFNARILALHVHQPTLHSIKFLPYEHSCFLFSPLPEPQPPIPSSASHHQSIPHLAPSKLPNVLLKAFLNSDPPFMHLLMWPLHFKTHLYNLPFVPFFFFKYVPNKSSTVLQKKIRNKSYIHHIQLNR